MSEPLAIVGAGVCCPVGLSVSEAATSLRAGVSRKMETGYVDGRGEAIVVGHLVESLLDPLEPALRSARPTRVERRVIRLARAPLREALAAAPVESPLPLLLAGPQVAAGAAALVTPQVLGLCARQAALGIDGQDSTLFALGRAGLFVALAQAGELLHSGRAPFVLVGGADSFLDAERLRGLASEGRLRGPGAGDTLTPGEGAALVLLTTRANCQQHDLTPWAWIAGVGLGREQGHRYSEAPYLGEGLAEAVADLYAKLPRPHAPIQLALTGLTGESMGVKEWGVTLLRLHDRFALEFGVEHAAEHIGDAGAALAPIMLACAAQRLREGSAKGPALLWGASDWGQRGALILYADPRDGPKDFR